MEYMKMHMNYVYPIIYASKILTTENSKLIFKNEVHYSKVIYFLVNIFQQNHISSLFYFLDVLYISIK